MEIVITTCDTTLKTLRIVNYLGIRLNPRLMFWTQKRHAAIKAAKVTSLLSGLMVKVGGRIQSRCRFMMSTTYSILFYDNEVAQNALMVDRRMKIISSVQ